MQIIFDDNGLHKTLAPFTLTRPVAEIRFGILTFKETWEALLSQYYPDFSVAFNTADYLQVKYPKSIGNNAETITVAGNIKPTKEIVEAISRLEVDCALFVNDKWVATRGTAPVGTPEKLQINELVLIDKSWHIFQKNDAAIAIDFDILTAGRKSELLSDTNRTTGKENIFIEKGAQVEHAILNASTGPIYIGANAEIMEGAVIRGPFALNESAVVKMAAKIYGATTIGPYCKVGGEISNCVFQAYSNKGHDGFLGNSVVGEWCNFGADTNSSNLKNNYSKVKVYSYETEQMELSNVLFCGILMGDHSKTGINTMFNTATVVGVSSNIFGAGFPKKYIPSFSWGGVDKTDRFILEKAFEVAQNMMSRRHIELTTADKTILTHLYMKLA